MSNSTEYTNISLYYVEYLDECFSFLFFSFIQQSNTNIYISTPASFINFLTLILFLQCVYSYYSLLQWTDIKGSFYISNNFYYNGLQRIKLRKISIYLNKTQHKPKCPLAIFFCLEIIINMIFGLLQILVEYQKHHHLLLPMVSYNFFFKTKIHETCTLSCILPLLYKSFTFKSCLNP